MHTLKSWNFWPRARHALSDQLEGWGWVCACGRSLWASLESQSRESVRFSEACDALWRTNGELTDLHWRIRTVDKQKRSVGRLELCFWNFYSISFKHFDSAFWLSDHILSGQSFIEVNPGATLTGMVVFNTIFNHLYK